MQEPTNFVFVVEASEADTRLDAFLAKRLPQYSRTGIRRCINDGCIFVDRRNRKPSYKLCDKQEIRGQIALNEPEGPQPEEIPLEVIYEDEDLAVINKPSGMVVHPAKGHWAGTLTSALAFHFRNLSQVGGPQRPGIIHRLDRDTSGVILIAKNDQAHTALASQFENREVEKEYYAICKGKLDRDRDWVRQPIGMHPYQREKMAIRGNHRTTRDAETFFEIDRRWKHFVSFRVFPKTGRTHQIRIHLAHIGCPVLCDPLYSGQRRLTAADLSEKGSASEERVLLDRLALHARRLKIRHPASGDWFEFEADIPKKLAEVTHYFEA